MDKIIDELEVQSAMLEMCKACPGQEIVVKVYDPKTLEVVYQAKMVLIYG